MKKTAFLGAWLLVGLAQPVQAAPCDDQFWRGVRPQLVNPKLAVKTRTLCKPGFEVLHSGVTRTALWSAEHLTRARLQAARGLDRRGEFFEDPDLPVDERATLADYRGSGYDRGHLAPNGDMGSRAQQAASFSLANMVPQNSELNRGPWSQMEQAVRALVMQEKEAYVITGPAYQGSRIGRIGQVLVPTQLWKAVYFPQRQAVGVYVAPNDGSGVMQVITLAELEKQIGIRLFPGLPDSVRTTRVDMPLGVGRTPARQAAPAQHDTQPDWVSLLERMVRALFR